MKGICFRLYKNKKGNHSKPNYKFFEDAGYYDFMTEMYRTLGGEEPKTPFNIGKFDIDLEDCIIELDEENHFNRYRLITLESPMYKDWKCFNVTDYQKYCDEYEKKCCTYGGYWNNSSSDKQYGGSSNKGDLNGKGSSRWKQRAFYDFVKDVYSMVTGVPVIRISIYDTYQSQSISDLILQEKEEELKQYIEIKRRKLALKELDS